MPWRPTRRGFGAPWLANVGAAVAVLVFAGIAALLPPVISIAVLAGVAVGVVMLVQPTAAVYLLVISVPYESLKEIHFGGFNVYATEFIAFCGGAALITQGLVYGEVSARWAWWRRPLLLFGLAMVVSMTQATSFSMSLKELLKLAEMLLTYLLVLAYIDTPTKLRRLLYVVVLAVLSQALLGIGQTLAHHGPHSFSRGFLERSSGTFGQPNPFAGYLNLTLPLLIAAVAMNVPLAGRLTKPALLIVGLALLVSESRGAIVAELAAIGVMMAIYKPRTRPLVAVGGIVAFVLVAGSVVGALPSAIGSKVAETIGIGVDVVNPTPVDWSTAERLAHMAAGLGMFFDHPLLGVGIGNYPAAYPHYRVAQVWGPDLGQAHNYFINIAAEAGIVGLAAFVYLLVAGFKITARLYRLAATPLARTLALGAIGVLVTVVVHSLFDDIFDHAMEAQVALVMGMATVSCRLSVASSQLPVARDAAPGIAAGSLPRG